MAGKLISKEEVLDPRCVGSRRRFHHRHCFSTIVPGVLLAALTQSCASSISFFLGLYVVGRIVRPLNRFDRVSDRNDKLERGSGYSKLRPTNNGVLQAVATSSHEERGAAHQIGKPRLTRLSVSRCITCPSSAFSTACRPRSRWTLPSCIPQVTSWAKFSD